MAIEPNYRCSTCPRCQAGDYHICRHFGFAGLMGHGGLAEYAAVPRYMVHQLPAGVPLEQAALFEPASVALHGTLAVVGLGPIGLLAVLLAARRGAARIIAVDVAPARLEIAARLGATNLVDASGGADAAAAIRALTGGEGADVAFEVVGSQAALDTCLGATRRGGRVVLVGLAQQVRLDAFALVNNEQLIISTVGYRDTYPELIRLVADEGVDLRPVVTSTVALRDVVDQGFEALLGGGREQIKVLVDPTPGPAATAPATDRAEAAR